MEDYDYIPVERTDQQLRSAARYQLEWPPWVNVESIQVQVQDGVVTLSGTVDTWYEQQEATEAVYEAGADKVRNHLEYDFGPDIS
ncbi:MAG TPA: BON domain-containing protein [bacterium]|nr:BON domain-containing protein [bacterium]